MTMIQSINPATGEVVAAYEEHTSQKLDSILQRAATAQAKWAWASFSKRAEPLRQSAALLRDRAKELAQLMAVEMGKPVEQGRAEVEKCAGCCEYFAEHAERFLAPEEIPTPRAHTFVAFQPLGTLLAIMPWNFPLWQVFRAAAPALMAGNAVVLKHASNVFGCALAIERIFSDAALPRGLFASALVGSRAVKALIAHPLVHAVTLTGSTEAGRSVAATAGQYLKKCVLELGGSDPYVVLEDADIKAAAATCATARLINSGQSCIAAKRFIAVSAVRREFEELLANEMASRRMGDPLDESTQIGPQARNDLRDSLHDQVKRSIAQGAKTVLGGELPTGAGAFYPATVLTQVRPGMAAFDEETFGPVAAVIEAVDEDEALALANRTSFGLGAAVFTRDVQRGERIAVEGLQAGCCFVNEYVRSDVRLPFGGIKDSGFGRELGIWGLREFVNVKTVWSRAA
jgi:succinate-semialdehyde dehydrogenase/glutarate-semialdehyde dehydrogenase